VATHEKMSKKTWDLPWHPLTRTAKESPIEGKSYAKEGSRASALALPTAKFLDCGGIFEHGRVLAFVVRAARDQNERQCHSYLTLKQAYILRIFVPSGDFGPGRTVCGQPARTAGEELFGVVHGRGSFLRLSP
jgi:hypothetical protein